jgi:hypothetical protein
MTRMGGVLTGMLALMLLSFTHRHRVIRMR